MKILQVFFKNREKLSFWKKCWFPWVFGVTLCFRLLQVKFQKKISPNSVNLFLYFMEFGLFLADGWEPIKIHLKANGWKAGKFTQFLYIYSPQRIRTMAIFSHIHLICTMHKWNVFSQMIHFAFVFIQICAERRRLHKEFKNKLVQWSDLVTTSWINPASPTFYFFRFRD